MVNIQLFFLKNHFTLVYTVQYAVCSACSLPWEVGNYTVCDNVDLKMVLTEFESYYQGR